MKNTFILDWFGKIYIWLKLWLKLRLNKKQFNVFGNRISKNVEFFIFRKKFNFKSSFCKISLEYLTNRIYTSIPYGKLEESWGDRSAKAEFYLLSIRE